MIKAQEPCECLVQGLGLAPDAARPLVACITRLVPQKGVGLIRRAIFRTLEQVESAARVERITCCCQHLKQKG